MTNTAREVLQRWEIRKSKKEKEAFRQWLCQQLREAGYAPQVEPRAQRRKRLEVRVPV